MATKFWVFTVNNNPATFQTNLAALYESKKDRITYICGQLEQGGETEHLHFQGYVQLNRSLRMSWVRNNISDTAHWEKQRGSNQQARKYCTPEKVEDNQTWLEDTFVEYGEFAIGRAGQGSRNDITDFVQEIKNGQSQRQLIDSHPRIFAKFIKFHDRVRSLYKPPSNDEGVKLILYVGDPGTGKTRMAHELYDDLYVVPISNGTMWLDGYDLHENVLFDDFMGAGSKMTLDNTLKYFDRYVQQVPVKGTHTWYKPKVVIVTTNYHPRHWYKWKGREISYKALSRRFAEVHCFFADQLPEEQIVEDYFYDREQWPDDEDTNVTE